MIHRRVSWQNKFPLCHLSYADTLPKAEYTRSIKLANTVGSRNAIRFFYNT